MIHMPPPTLAADLPTQHCRITKRAISDFGYSIRLNPQNSAAYVHRGVSYSALGEHDREPLQTWAKPSHSRRDTQKHT